VNVLSLFAGIGGLELGLERAGMTTVGQVEIDPYCRSVLAHHWPGVPQHDDVRTAPDWWLGEPRPQVDVVCGGFPCQPFSEAGSRLGTADERWGWPWFADVVRAVRPHYVVVENVAALLRYTGAFGVVLSDLAALGFDAQWSVLSACALGAPHTRERLFLVADADSIDGPKGLGSVSWPPALRPGDVPKGPWIDPVDGLLAAHGDKRGVADGPAAGLEPSRVAAVGNAVVPQVAEYIGRLIVAADGLVAS
jgi:DNA (cytosine-5)-methyltransferase 1